MIHSPFLLGLLALSSAMPPALPPHASAAASNAASNAAPNAGAQDSPFRPGSTQFEGKQYPFLLLPPEKPVEGETYPLVLFFHGSGERGSDNRAQLAHFPERMATEAYRKKFPCYLLAPQCPEGATWYDFGEDRLNAPMQAAVLAMKEVLESEPIDRDRVYVTGLSMGGGGLFDLIRTHGNWFAAAAPICGRNDLKAAYRFAGLPLSIWHGTHDEIIAPSYSRNMMAKLEALGAEAEYHELADVGHNSWEKAYDTDGVLPWLFSKRRDLNRGTDVAAAAFARSMAPDARVAFLGDSITQYGANKGGYVDQLREALHAVHPKAPVIAAGISGNTVPDLLRRYRADVIDKEATVVFLYIGINDVWRSQDGTGTPIQEFEAGLRTLVQDIKESGASVVLATPTVIGEKHSGENPLDEMLDQFADVTRTVAAEEGAVLCDLRRAFTLYLDLFNPDNKAKGILTSDGVHLTPLGNRLVALEAARALAAQ